MKETRAFAEFQSKDEYVEAMVEDLAEWLNFLYNLKDENELTPENFFQNLKNGVILCKHAHVVQSLAEGYLNSSTNKGRSLPMKIGTKTLHVPLQPPKYTIVDFSKTVFHFHERDNVSNFILWCRNFNIPDGLTFETEDLVGMKNQRSVVIALLELSRIGRLFGMEVPDIIELEQEIEDEINKANIDETDAEITSINNNNDVKDSKMDLCNNTFEGTDSGIEVIKDDIKLKEFPIIIVDESVERKLDERDKQNNNSAVEEVSLTRSLGKERPFGFKGRRSSANFPLQDFPLNSNKATRINRMSNCLPNKNSILQSNSVEEDNPNGCIKKSQSVYFDGEGSHNVIIIDNSDNESNFSQSSHSNFVMPKYKTPKPVGRVKIYDNFDKSNYVKEKKTREKVDLRSLDDRVREILSQCKCEETFPMKRISEGKYQWGDKQNMIFVRILRTHVMVRVGGGWNTLGDFLIKHDSCRKGKCENFKFCLPAQTKKSQTGPNDIDLLLRPSNTCPGNLFHFQQGMLKVTSSRNSFDCGDNHIVTEEKNETETALDKENLKESNKQNDTKSHLEELQDLMKPEEIKKNLSVSLGKAQNPSLSNGTVKLRKPLKISDQKQQRRSSLTLIHSPGTLRTKFDEMITEQKNSMPVGKDTLLKSASKIPKIRYPNKK